MALRDYNFSHVVVLLDGLPISGYNADDGVEIEYQSDIYTTSVGADGEVVRSSTNDRTATITIHLNETSPINAYLRAKALASRTVGFGDKIAFFLKDPLTNETVTAAECYIQTDPGVSKGRDAGARDWVLMAADLLIVGV